MTASRRAFLVAPLALTAAAARAQGLITGTAAYRERIALPPGAVLEVELRDTSRADAPATVLATARVEAAGQVPIPFALRYDPAAIDPGRIYTVAARLSVGGAVRWRSDRVHRVLTGGAGSTVEILLVAGGAAAEPDAPRAALAGAPWLAREIGGRPVDGPHRAEITFDPQGRAYGTGGCNRFTGGVTLSGASLRFGPMAQTNMACEEAAMAQEARFHEALAAVRAFRVEAGVLVLLDSAGKAAMRLAR
jgi:putative lipoprotein